MLKTYLLDFSWFGFLQYFACVCLDTFQEPFVLQELFVLQDLFVLLLRRCYLGLLGNLAEKELRPSLGSDVWVECTDGSVFLLGYPSLAPTLHPPSHCEECLG